MTKAMGQVDSSTLQFNQQGSVSWAALSYPSTISQNNSVSFLTNFLSNNNSDVGFSIYNTETDKQNFTHQKFQQIYKGLPVYSGRYFAHSFNGYVTSINGNYLPINISTVTPNLTESQALNYALANINAVSYLWQNSRAELALKQNQNNVNATYYPVGELVIVPKSYSGLANDELAYLFSIACEQPNDDIKIFINANNGVVIKKYSEKCHTNAPGTALTSLSGSMNITCNRYTSNNYKLEMLYSSSSSKKFVTNDFNNTVGQLGSNINPSIYTNTNTTWGSTWLTSNPSEHVALDAHWATEKTFSFWETVLGRPYLNTNNSNMTIGVNVHFQGMDPLDVAQWSPRRNTVELGDGNVVFHPLVSLDIVAHELGHALAKYTSDFDANGGSVETQAISESLSDIWGVCVENYANQDPLLTTKKNIWTTGEEVIINKVRLPYFRSFVDVTKTIDIGNNSLVTNLPDCYLSTNWNNLHSRNLDEGHYATGVVNKWFYLICNGSSGGVNAVGNTFNPISALATQSGGLYNLKDVIDIIYIAENNYLPPSPSFADLRMATIQACIQLWGANSAQECAVTEAWYAVNVGAKCTPQPPPILCNLSAYAPINGVYTQPTNTNGKYYFNQNTYIQGNVTFTNADIFVQNGATIFVDDNATLTLKGCHLRTCAGMWNGIQVYYNAKLILNDYNGKSNLIEDAKIAVDYDGGDSYPNYTGNIIDISNTIFNRNNISIKLSNYTSDSKNASIYPFSIKNSIITCRKIEKANGTWDNVTTIKGGSWAYAQTPNVYTQPYINNALYSDIATEAYLKNIYYPSFTTKKSESGIIINRVNGMYGTNPGAGMILGNVGNATNPNTLIFDNLENGVKIITSNIDIKNCTFQKPVGTGIGIDAQGSLAVNTSINITNPNATTEPTNAFYDMKYAVKVSDYKNVDIENCFIASNQNSSISNSYCTGIYVVAENKNASTKINNNNIYNVQYGISLCGFVEAEEIDPTVPNPFNPANIGLGAIEINSNTIAQQMVGAATTPTNPFVMHAIHTGALINGNGAGTATLTCSDNQITDVFNGITFNYWQGKQIIAQNNNPIKLIENTTAINPTAEQYGILLAGGSTNNGSLSLLQDNVITGCGVNKLNTGISVKMQGNTALQCNKVNNAQNGYKYNGVCPLTKFTDNFIYSTNQNGLYLDHAVIGRQGNDGDGGNSPADVCTSNNDWNVDAATWIGSNKNMIYSNNTIPNQSEFVVRGSSQFVPTGGYATFYQNLYTLTNGIVTTSLGDWANNCPRCSGHPKRIKNIQEILDEIAAGTIELPNDEAVKRLEVMQQQLYELVKARPELAANSTDIQQFIYDNQWNSLDFIYYLGYFAAKGNMNQVDNILNYWLPTSSELDDNYRTYYEWLVAMYNNPEYKPSAEEVLAYANKCPIKNGTIIYAIRNFYNAITKEIHNFEDDCNNNNNQRISKQQTNTIRLKQPKPKVSVENKLVIYPNPVSNVLNIATTNVKKIEIVDIMGKVVMQKSVGNASQTSLSISELQKGIYVIKAISAQGKILMSKFIKE